MKSNTETSITYKTILQSKARFTYAANPSWQSKPNTLGEYWISIGAAITKLTTNNAENESVIYDILANLVYGDNYNGQNYSNATQEKIIRDLIVHTANLPNKEYTDYINILHHYCSTLNYQKCTKILMSTIEKLNKILPVEDADILLNQALKSNIVINESDLLRLENAITRGIYQLNFEENITLEHKLLNYLDILPKSDTTPRFFDKVGGEPILIVKMLDALFTQRQQLEPTNNQNP